MSKLRVQILSALMIWGGLLLTNADARPLNTCEDMLEYLSNAGHYQIRIDPEKNERPNVRIMSQSEKKLSDPDKVDAIKQKILSGEYDYVYGGDVVSGIYASKNGILYIDEGHHRLAAALEIAEESGDWRPLRRMLRYGVFSERDYLSTQRKPLPTRQNPAASKPLLPDSLFQRVLGRQ